MPVTVVCPACSATLPGVPDELVGKTIKCTSCREPVKVNIGSSGSVAKAAALPPATLPVVRPMAKPVVVAPPPTADLGIDVEVMEDEPDADSDMVLIEEENEPTPPRPAKPAIVSRPPQVVSARRPVPPPTDDDDDPTPVRSVKQLEEEDERPTPPRAVAKAAKTVAPPSTKTRSEKPPARYTRERDDEEEYRPVKKKSALPLILGLLVGLVVLGGAAFAVVMLTKQTETAQGTTTSPAAGFPNGTPNTPLASPSPITSKPSTPVNPSVNPPKPIDPPKPVDPPVVTPKPIDPPKPVDPPVKTPVNQDRISAEALAKLKRGTVYIEVDDGNGGGGTGSGWFGGEPGLVITNAHVVGMIYPGAKEPARITVYTNPGLKAEQKQYDGPKVKLLAVDRDMDLAVLQIIGESDLPPPLPTRPAAQTKELDKLVCLGFPGGRRLADRNRSTDPPSVTVTESSVSAFRTDDGGNLYSVQLQGGVVHGNSGGPVCDLDGNVIGVAVRVDIDHRNQMTNIAYAVPVEYVAGLLAGRAAERTIGQGYIKGDRVVYPVSVRCADALNRLKAVGVAVWVGEKGKPRPAGDRHVEDKGDIGYREIPLSYDKVKKVAIGEIDFPRDADGRFYWAQPYYSNTLTSKQFLAGTPLPTDDLPVERTPADLAPRYPVGSEFTLSMNHLVKVYERVEKDGTMTFDRRTVLQQLKAKELVEKAKSATAHAQLDLVMDGDAARIEVLLPGDKPAMPKDLLDAKENLTRWNGLLAIGRDGKPTGNTVAQLGLTATLDAAKKEMANRLANQWVATVGESVVRLPGRSVRAGESWSDNLTHRFKLRPEHLLGDLRGTVGTFGTVKEEVTYTYIGRRDRAGRGEVVLKVEGILRPVGSDTTTCGSVEGRVVLDERTGMVTEGVYKREFDLELKEPGQTVRATGTEEVKVERKK